jgi:hypothetical protein
LACQKVFYLARTLGRVRQKTPASKYAASAWAVLSTTAETRVASEGKMSGWDQLLSKRPPKYPCGHPRTLENTLTQPYKTWYARRCKTCHMARIQKWFYGRRRKSKTIPVRDSFQWDQCYRGIIGWYRRKAYQDRNPFFVEPYVDESGVMQ